MERQSSIDDSLSATPYPNDRRVFSQVFLGQSSEGDGSLNASCTRQSLVGKGRKIR